VELKHLPLAYCIDYSLWFNRTSVELKQDKSCACGKGRQGFNRTSVELKH